MTRVYISATRLDLATECEAVKDWLSKMGHQPVDSYIPDSQPVLESCRTDVESCDLCVLILGHHYGFRPPENNPEKLSITHLEFRHAGERDIPRIVLQQSGIPDVERADIFDSSEMAALQAFHSEVAAAVRPARFAGKTALIEQLCVGVTSELKKLGRAPNAAALHEPLRRASRDLLAWRTTLPTGEWLERPELESLRQRIHTAPQSTTLLLGEPGCGKSAMLARLGQSMQAEGIPVLGIKADLLPDDTLTPQALTNYLELPLPVLATVRALAEEGPVVVLVDQLDALAELVVQHSARLRTLLNLIRDLDEIPNVHVVASCRGFEQRHDPSLRNLEADLLTLELPAWDAVDAILQTRGVQAGGWNPEMRETLRSPHALDTFLSLLSGNDELSLAHGFQGMLQVQWERKVLCDAGGGKKRLLLDLAQRMAEKEMLWLPLAMFEERYEIVQALRAAGLLIMEEGGGRIAFRHQTLYEFVRARSFLDTEMRLTETVLAGQSSLRIRPQFWHALVYLRRVAPELYQDELKRLWAAALRPHLRMLLIEFLGTQPSPLGEEVRLAFQNFGDPWFQRRFLSAAVGSAGWFDALLPNHLPMLMARSAQEAAAALPILDRALAFSPQAVLGLIDAHWLADPDKDKLSWQLLAMGRLPPPDTAWVDRLEHILSRADLAAWTLAHVASTVSAALPGEAPRLVAAGLWRQWRILNTEIELGPSALDEPDTLSQQTAPQTSKIVSLLEGRELHDLTAAAEAAPRRFIQAIWPLFLEMLEAISAEAHPFVVGYRENPALIDDLDADEHSRFERPLLEAIALAVDTWAAAEPDAFLEFLEANAGRDQLLAQRLLARGLVHCAAEHTAVALEFLCADPRRLVLGPYSNDHRDSKALIEAVTPHLDDAQYQRLEKTIVGWHRYSRAPDDAAETRFHRLRYDRQHRLRLLRALPKERRSPSTRRLLQEEERAFPYVDDRDMWISGFHRIGSPVSAEQMQAGQDEDILNLFSQLTDEHQWDHPRERMKGGAIQAGRELARLAEIDVERAVRLVRALKPEHNETPVSEVIRNLIKAGYERNAVYVLIEELAAKGFASKKFHQACAHVVEEAASEKYPVPGSLLCLLESWLLAVDPASADIAHENAVREQKESLLWGHGRMSILPSGNFPILSALSSACLVVKPPLIERWLHALGDHLARSESPRVWAAVAWRYLRWQNLAEPARAQSFLDRLFAAYPAVLGSIEGIHLMAYLQHWIAPHNARRWLEIMHHAGEHGAQGCGELLMLRHALFPAEDWPREQVGTLLASTEAATREERVGVAHAVVHLWSEAKHRTLAHGYLLPLLASEDADVLHAVGGIFLSHAFLPDQPTRTLLDALCEHPALLRDRRAEYLGEHLETLLAVEPERVARLCNALLDQAGEAMGNMATSWYLSSEPILDVALMLQDIDAPHRTAGLALFERMLEFNLPQAHEMALNLDKRTPNLSAASRPSIRRRKKQKK